MIFIPLATLKAACRNQPSNWFLMIVVNLARLARSLQMADAEVLLDDISDFGDGLVALDLQLGELGSGGVLAHDAIFDVVEGEKITVGFPSPC
jgi:hypothetical protein